MVDPEPLVLPQPVVAVEPQMDTFLAVLRDGDNVHHYWNNDGSYHGSATPEELALEDKMPY